MIDARAMALLDHLPSAGSLRIVACVIVILLGCACLRHLHVPRRDRGGFVP